MIRAWDVEATQPKRRRSRRLSGKFEGRFHPKCGNNVYDRTKEHFNAIRKKR